ncbi:hypothetical protein BY996DRAFT_6411110 [Phakopsora pachyrhizi]|nr:hypothetical protein BY996DRAFT_6411110 [Phakopsora pachyrhizi]
MTKQLKLLLNILHLEPSIKGKLITRHIENAADAQQQDAHFCCSAKRSSPDNSCAVHYWAKFPEPGPSTALESHIPELIYRRGDVQKGKNQMIPGTILVPGFNIISNFNTGITELLSLPKLRSATVL